MKATVPVVARIDPLAARSLVDEGTMSVPAGTAVSGLTVRAAPESGMARSRTAGIPGKAHLSATGGVEDLSLIVATSTDSDLERLVRV
jgi:hypothetical protein